VARLLRTRDLERLRSLTTLLLAAMAGGIGVAWWFRFSDEASQAAIADRIAFFAAVAVLFLNLGLIRAAWCGRAHLALGLSREVPFESRELAGESRFSPTVRSYGVSGRLALLGVGLVISAALAWLGVLALVPLSASGELSLVRGDSTSEIQPWGSGSATALPHRHSFLGVLPSGEGVRMLVENPANGFQTEYEVSRERPVRLGAHRIALTGTSVAEPVAGLRVIAEGPTGSEALDLMIGYRTSSGDRSWQIRNRTERFLDTEFPAFRVAEVGPGAERTVWLIPEAAELDIRHADAEVRLRPVEELLTESALLTFTPRWFWWWRVGVLAIAGGGVFLIVLVPHRSWRWSGESGDYRFSAWSLNAAIHLPSWVDDVMRELLGPSGFEELKTIEEALS
jgi:hypothetical protein